MEAEASVGVMTASIEPMTTAISIEFIKTFFIISIVSTAAMGSFVIALINYGNWHRGFKYLPLFCTAAIIIFFMIRQLLLMTIGAMI
jgi:hypothetical protein